MSTKQSSIIPAQIYQLQKLLDAWRKARKRRSRIPGRLWDSAVQVAGQCGLNRTARALHLNYYDLKKRIDIIHVNQGPAPSFIELNPSAVSGSTPECIIELETRNGEKMRVQMKGMGVPDLNALSQVFWRSAR